MEKSVATVGTTNATRMKVDWFSACVKSAKSDLDMCKLWTAGVGIGQRKVRNQMQVVINVPDKVYEMVMNTGTYGCYRFNSTKAIKDGVPLPKGHGKLKDVSELTPDSSYDYYDNEFFAVSIGQIKSAPTIVEADEEGEDAE